MMSCASTLFPASQIEMFSALGGPTDCNTRSNVSRSFRSIPNQNAVARKKQTFEVEHRSQEFRSYRISELGQRFSQGDAGTGFLDKDLARVFCNSCNSRILNSNSYQG